MARIAREKEEIDAKMKRMMRELAFYVIFLILLVIVANGNRDANSFLQNENLRTVFAPDSNDVSPSVILP